MRGLYRAGYAQGVRRELLEGLLLGGALALAGTLACGGSLEAPPGILGLDALRELLGGRNVGSLFALARMFAAGIPAPLALLIVERLAAGALLGGAWTLARRVGAPPWRAALVAALALGPLALSALRLGELSGLSGGFALLAAWGLSQGRPLPRTAGILGFVWAAWSDGGMGFALGAALALAAPSRAERVAFAAAGLLAAGHGPAVPGNLLDPWDVLAPLYAPRADGLAPGLAALALALLVLPERDASGWAWRRGALGAWVLALGPILRLGGQAVEIAGHAVPLPGIVPALLGGEAGGVGACLVAGAFVALGLARDGAELPRALRAGLGLLAGAELLRVALSGPWQGLPAAAGPALEVLRAREGGILVLPAALPGLPGSAPLPSGARSRWIAHASGRNLVTVGVGRDVLLAEPSVVAAGAVVSGDGELRVPPTPAGAALRARGVTDLVLDRSALPPEVLARLDPVLGHLLGPPQRDHAAGLDLYRVPSPPTLDPLPVPLVRGAAPAEGWRTIPELLAPPASAQPGGVAGAGAPAP